MKTIKTLLVDDDYLVIQDLKNLVDWNKLGFQITGTATNGKTALALATKQKPELIITDISMPVMDGFDFIETVKKDFPNLYYFYFFLRQLYLCAACYGKWNSRLHSEKRNHFTAS